MILNGFKIALLLATSVFLSEANVIGRNSHSSYSNFDAFTTIQGEWFNISSGAWVQNTCGGIDVASYLVNDRVIGFYDVDFGSNGASDIFIQYSNGETASGTYGFELFIDYPTNNQPFAQLEIQQTGSYCAFLQLTLPLPNSPTELSDLFFRFSSPSSTLGAMNLDFFKFIQQTTTSTTIMTTTETPTPTIETSTTETPIPTTEMSTTTIEISTTTTETVTPTTETPTTTTETSIPPTETSTTETPTQTTKTTTTETLAPTTETPITTTEISTTTTEISTTTTEVSTTTTEISTTTTETEKNTLWETGNSSIKTTKIGVTEEPNSLFISVYSKQGLYDG
ncbi:hypothetical protein CHUAL_008507 [Chamberlinius hualienensis]